MSRSSATESFQRVGFLSCVPELLRKSGANVADVLAAAGLTEHALDDRESKIPYRVMGLLLQEAAQRTRCPSFGLEVGKQVRTTTLGLLGELMRNSPTLRVALTDFVSHQHRNADGGAAYLLEYKHQAFFGYVVYQPNVPGAHQICDGAAMAAFSLIRELAGNGNVSSLEVLLSRSEPGNVIPYRRAFGVQLFFDAAQTSVVMPVRVLDQIVTGADPRLRLMLEKRIQALSHAGDLDTVTQLRRALRVEILNGGVSAIKMASQMGMSRRTLSRKLDVAGIRFQEVLDETRLEFVQQLLANTHLSISKIGAIVGYSDPSTLTRSFCRSVGVTPSAWRSKSKHLIFECGPDENPRPKTNGVVLMP
jgi:AraC-like DNA-binding protein